MQSSSKIVAEHGNAVLFASYFFVIAICRGFVTPLAGGAAVDCIKFPTIVGYYCATLCVSAVFAVARCPSVCPSHWWIVSTRLRYRKFAIFDWNSHLSRKRYEVGPWLLWNVNRKSYAADRFVSVLMTMSDP